VRGLLPVPEAVTHDAPPLPGGTVEGIEKRCRELNIRLHRFGRPDAAVL